MCVTSPNLIYVLYVYLMWLKVSQLRLLYGLGSEYFTTVYNNTNTRHVYGKLLRRDTVVHNSPSPKHEVCRGEVVNERHNIPQLPKYESSRDEVVKERYNSPQPSKHEVYRGDVAKEGHNISQPSSTRHVWEKWFKMVTFIEMTTLSD